MTEIEYRIADLINFSSTQKPIEFGQAFNEIMSSKVADIIADKKIEMAKSVFNPSSDEESESEEEVNAEVA